MKPISFFLLTVFCLTTLCFFNNATFAQVGSPEYVVRVIYFLPSDRTPQPDINEKLDKLVKDTQLFYAEQMTAHGFGTKTFEFEADTAGKVVVHRINGQFNDAYYISNTSNKVWQEIQGRFDLSNNIWLTALDISTESLHDSQFCGLGAGSSLQGTALMPASGHCFNVTLTAHELGHAFGLKHDNRIYGKWIPTLPDSFDPMVTSFCSAEWLDAHRYFKVNQTLSINQRIAVEILDRSLTASSPSAPSEITHLCGVGSLDDHEYFKVNQTVPGDTPPTFGMLGPPSLAAAPNAIRLRFRVTDADGIHQVQLHTPEWDPYRAGGFIACKRVNGTSATVEFVTTELSPRSESVWLVVIDVHGNFVWSERYPIAVTTVLPPATAVSIPDVQLAAAIRQKIGNITTHSLLNLRFLDIPTGTTNLTGLEQAHNLRVLGQNGGEIADLRPLANLTSLWDLNFFDNQISDITALENLTNLRNLVLVSNQISDITALENLTNLRTLYLNSNQISDITALENLTNLRSLGLNSNQISDITALENLTNLRTLYLNSNQISDITALENLTNLRNLNLSGNNVNDITAFRNLTNLTTLYMDRNNLSDITALSGLTNLTSLSLGGNNLSDITVLSGLTNLRALWLWHNQIKNVRPLVSLVNLEKLYLAGNPIQDFSPLRTLLANNPNLKIDIDIPEPPPLGFSPDTMADQTFTVGEAVTLTLPVATGGTLPYTYTLTPLPEGLSFNPTERVLSGKPTTVETTTATYTATDAANMSASLTFTIEVTEGVILDVNGDGQVNVIDLSIVALSYGTQVPADTSLPADVNADGIVNILDLTAVAQAIDAASGGDGLSLQAVEAALLAAAEQAAGIEAIAEAPMGFGDQHQHTLLLRITYDNVADALADVRHLATGDVRLGKGVTVLEELLQLLMEMSTIPETTALLPNYPNPFNPETWLPYQLATPAWVTLSIYSVDGRLVRTLAVGHQPAGVYRSKSRAAYWDGRNDEGEPVASGLYFYTLRTGDFAATRKLIIRK